MSTKTQNFHISLTPALADYVNELLATGLYSNISEVIREALREKYQTNKSQTQKLQKLRDLVKVGLDQVERGEVVETSLEDMLERVRARKN
jgi:antitoxin ParD1/3/4